MRFDELVNKRPVILYVQASLNNFFLPDLQINIGSSRFSSDPDYALGIHVKM